MPTLLRMPRRKCSVVPAFAQSEDLARFLPAFVEKLLSPSVSCLRREILALILFSAVGSCFPRDEAAFADRSMLSTTENCFLRQVLLSTDGTIVFDRDPVLSAESDCFRRRWFTYGETWGAYDDKSLLSARNVLPAEHISARMFSEVASSLSIFFGMICYYDDFQYVFCGKIAEKKPVDCHRQAIAGQRVSLCG